MKMLSIFEPQIEKHHAYKKKHVDQRYSVKITFLNPDYVIRNNHTHESSELIIIFIS